MPRRNHVLLLRHCVRSTHDKIRVCDGDGDANGTARKALLSEYVATPLPEWDVPSLWCTERGVDLIWDLGGYLVGDAIDMPPDARVVVKIVSDTHQRNVDTSLALLRSMKDALEGRSYAGLDRISVDHEVFGHSSSWPETTCPSTHFKDREIYDEISDRITRLPPSDFRVQEMLDRIASLGGFNETIVVGNDASPYAPCPGTLSLPLALLVSAAEMALYSRASDVDPPFLPAASDDDVYRMTRAADYVGALEALDNKDSAKRGLVLAKSVLGALLLGIDSDDDAGGPGSRAGEDDDDEALVAITVFVGHHSNINHVATALGLRWTMPPPYAHGSDDDAGRVVSTPPGSGIMFSSSSEEDGDVSMSYVAPVNLIRNETTDMTDHQLVPIYTIDMARPESAVRDDRSRNGTITANELLRRVRATTAKYPELRPCYADAPTLLGLEEFREKTALNATTFFLVAIVVVNAIGYALLLTARRGSSEKYEQVQQLDKPPEVELC